MVVVDRFQARDSSALGCYGSDVMLGLSLPVFVALAFVILIVIGAANLLFPEYEDAEIPAHGAAGQNETPESRMGAAKPEPEPKKEGAGKGRSKKSGSRKSRSGKGKKRR